MTLSLNGQSFGRLVAIKPMKRRKGGMIAWLCRCECGNLATPGGSDLKKGHTKSCGCVRRKKASLFLRKFHYKHGEGKPPTNLYIIWSDIKQRCFNPNDRAFKYYGGKGIMMCEEWKNDYTQFRDWALNNGYQKGLTTDRINHRGNYEPTNCQFLTRSENTKKQRKRMYNEQTNTK